MYHTTPLAALESALDAYPNDGALRGAHRAEMRHRRPIDRFLLDSGLYGALERSFYGYALTAPYRADSALAGVVARLRALARL